MNVLIVEDESIVAMELKAYIRRLGYKVVGICSKGEEAIKLLTESPIDTVLMDIYLKSDIDGIETAARMKQMHTKLQVIFLTAHTDDYNVNRAIALDPVAYLAKPIHLEELRIFLKIAAKKTDNISTQNKKGKQHLQLDNEFCYNTKSNLLYYHNEVIHLTNKESALLRLLVNNRNKIIDYYSISNLLWPDREVNTNTIRSLVRRLREKLKYKFIETIPAQGYKLTTDTA